MNAADYLPLDTKSANFDNIADAQLLSPTLLEAYLNAAATVSLMAVGDKNAPLSMTTYRVSPYISQHPWDHVDGAPYGTRGGIVAQHTFVADGLYELRFNVAGGIGTQLEDIDVSIDGERVALAAVRARREQIVRRRRTSRSASTSISTEPLKVTAGPHRVSVAFVRRGDGPYEDLIKPHDWSLASGGTASSGTTMPPHIMDLGIVGPQNAVGVSETPSRRIIFSCRPSTTVADTACAAADPDPSGHESVSPSADAARHGGPHVVLQARRAVGRLRGRHSLGAAGDAGEPVLRVPLRDDARERRRQARTTRSATTSSRRASRSSSGAASPTIAC